MIDIDVVTKIEGHARLHIKTEKGVISKAHLEVEEGARFFEEILKGRRYDEVAVLASRICGICSCIHITASLTALETALGIEVSEQTNKLRELMCLGERIRSHITHLYLLVLPDYLGYGSTLEMRSDHKEEVNRALTLIQLGNNIIATITGREMHPISSVVGGFSRIPEQEALDDLLEELKEHKKDFTQTAKLFTGLKYPEFQREMNYFSLDNYEDYFRSGGMMSCQGNICIPARDFDSHIREYLDSRSSAKFAVIEGKSYMVGALSRMNNTMDQLGSDARKLAKNLKFPSHNPFMNNAAQAIELIDNVDRAIKLMEGIELAEEKLPRIKAKKCEGASAVEAPRGLLFHKYALNNKGEIASANIITPTAQNLRNMEESISAFLPIANKSGEKAVLELKKLLRSYDPCISCSVH